METATFEHTRAFNHDASAGGPTADTADRPHVDPPFEARPAPSYTDSDWFERASVLNGVKVCVLSQNFRGGRITSVLSGVTIDLREAVLAPEGATLHVQSALSGVDVLVPAEWDVVCDVDAVCAGVHGDRPPHRMTQRGPRLCVKGAVVAGGLTVR
jgi:hypothetical protein